MTSYVLNASCAVPDVSLIGEIINGGRRTIKISFGRFKGVRAIRN